MPQTAKHMVPSCALRAVAALLTAGLSLGCPYPDQDKFQSQGGISPDPSARVEGTVLYIGPAPQCDYDDNDRPVRVRGRVFLTLFEYSDPPPPEGTATTSLNVAGVDGNRLFPLTDCLPKDAPQDLTQRLTRSAPFQWPKLPLLPNREGEYQIRGFYDYDEDMVPFFSITRIPTAGDVIGAALNDVQDASRGLFRLKLPPIEQARDGFVLQGVTVALGNVVHSERPAFRFDENRRMNSETKFPALVVGGSGANGPAMLRNARLETCAAADRTNLDGATCGLTLLRLSPDEEPKLLAAGVELALNDPKSYSFYAEPVDIRTVRTGGVADDLVPDGQPDPHPFLAGLGIPWYTPMLIMQRAPVPSDASRTAAATQLEQAARIPRVLMIGSVLMEETTPARPTQASYRSAPMGVLPVAAVELIPGRADCRVPYFERTTMSLFTERRIAHCGELPSGYYTPSVLGGVAAGTRSDSTDPRHESGVSIVGARYSGQSWSIPNELALADQVGAENVVAGQGLIDGSFVVYDPDPNSPPGTVCQGSFGRCEPGVPPVPEDAMRGFAGYDQLSCVPDDCCAAIEHLCNVPLCEATSRADGNVVRESPVRVTGTAPNGASIPDCIPFEMPAQCCPPRG